MVWHFTIYPLVILVQVICGFQQVIGMRILLLNQSLSVGIILSGLFELDADVAKERYAILDRVTMKLIRQASIKPGVTVRHLVRKSYALSMA